MNLFLYLFRQFRLRVLVATLAGLVSGLSAAGIAVLISRALAAEKPEALLGLLFFACCLIHLVAKIYSETRLLELNQLSIAHLRMTLSRRILATPQAKLQVLGRQPLLNILTRDVDSFTTAFQFMPIMIGNLVILIACFAYLLGLSPKLFLVFIAILVAGVTLFRLAERRPLSRLAAVRQQIDTLYTHFRALIEGSRELQLNRARSERFLEKVIAPVTEGVKTDFVASMRTYIRVTNTANILFYVVIGAFVFGLPRLLAIPSSEIVAVTLILLYLIRPVTELIIILPVVRQAGIALGRIEQISGDLARIEPEVPAKALFPASGAPILAFSGIRHRYSGGGDEPGFVLGPLDLEIAPGETLFLVGGNGSGKSTFAMILLGLFTPEAGTIRFRGVEVTEANRDAYRQHFSAVFSDFHLFEQVMDAGDDATAARAAGYLAALKMDHKVTIRDGAFSTLDLSTGQRKRLALVSAYLEDRDIYLFDEWAADQDPAFRRVFYETLLPELKARGKTVIAITHDEAYFAMADRIVKLVDGKLACGSGPA
ncbi:MAG: cyclic peptide export ABC transporter [Proteobacteria bacterium]|nr:cyclic peptide export ABC transporter [Pseudomonadota bacterium]